PMKYVMNRVIVACVLGWAAVLTGCGSENDPELTGGEVDGADLPSAIALEVARAPDRAARVQVVEAWRARRAEVTAFLDGRGGGWDSVDTRRPSSGQLFDYVRAETLYPGAPDAPFAQPPPLPAEEDVGVGVARARSEFDTDPSLRPPEGTIAVARPSF